jgi:hypothetical protein
MPAGCLYAPDHDFVQKHPNTCQALATAIVQGLKWMQTAGPSDIIKTVPEATCWATVRCTWPRSTRCVTRSRWTV